MPASLKCDHLLSLCVVSCDNTLLLQFLEHHWKLLQKFTEIELLIFVEHSQLAEISDWLDRADHTVQLICDGIPSGPNRKRKELLHKAKGQYVWFLDDDSWIMAEEKSFEFFLNEVVSSNALWILLPTEWRHRDKTLLNEPRGFKMQSPGTGIEWNQLFSRNTLINVGGWNIDFCTGERWCSGGALDLMFRLSRAGLRQTILSNISVSHPLQIQRGWAAVKKGRRYRYAVGAVLSQNIHLLNMSDLFHWVVRLVGGASVGSIVAAMRFQFELCLVRICAPLDVANGFFQHSRWRKHSKNLN